MTTITLNASSIASITGYNPYTTLKESLESVVFKNPHLSLKSSISSIVQLDTCRKSDLTKLLDKLEQSEKEQLQITLGLDKNTSLNTYFKNETNKIVNVKTEHHATDLVNQLVKLLPEKIQGDINGLVAKQRGTVREKSAIENLEKTNNTTIIKTNKLKHCCLLKTDTFNVIVCGIIDGYDTVNNRLIETKNRRNRFFNVIPEYEKVQLEMYMVLHDKNEILHIENFNGVYKEILYKQDLLFLETIKTNIIEFLQTHFEV